MCGVVGGVWWSRVTEPPEEVQQVAKGLAMAVVALAVGPSVVRPQLLSIHYTGHLTGTRSAFGRVCSVRWQRQHSRAYSRYPNVISASANRLRLAGLRVRPSPVELYAANT